ncbi:MAG: amino acid ABC transporter permease [Micropruina sp.]|nr:amino acid ABC transporter permease [Micropruina sp.]
MAELFASYDILGAFWVTILITFWSAVGAMVLGTIAAIMRVSPVRPLQIAASAYIEGVRNSPLTLVVFFFFFALYQLMGMTLVAPSARSSTHAFLWGVVAMAVYHSAFVAEALQSGINTVPTGQAEAARAIGLDFTQSLREVILPQALRGAVSPLGSTMIALTKNTTVLATIGVAEASDVMRTMIEFRPDLLYVIFLIMAFGFVVLTLPMGMAFTALSKRLVVRR